MDSLVERWPGYDRQSWAERFAEMDRINQQRHEENMALIKQIGDQMRQNAAKIEALTAERDQARARVEELQALLRIEREHRSAPGLF